MKVVEITVEMPYAMVPDRVIKFEIDDDENDDVIRQLAEEAILDEFEWSYEVK